MKAPDRAALMVAALALFAERGFSGTTLEAIAERAGLERGEAAVVFPTRHSIVMALYGDLADQLAESATSLPNATVAVRFAHAMRRKLELIEPQRRALSSLFASALDPESEVGVLSPGTAHIRSRVAGVFGAVVSGAVDCPAEPERLSRLLYGLHLSLILLWVQDRSDGARATHEAIELIEQLLGALPMLALFPGSGDLLAKADRIFGPTFQGAELAGSEETADLVLDRLFHHRRLHADEPEVASAAARALHRPAIRASIDAGEPIELVLPAFPAKAPNPSKVLGTLPDLAEELALQHLRSLMDRIAEAHPVTLRICSDGHVFADVVGVPDADVAAYRARLSTLLPADMEMFDLMDVFGDCTPDEARARLLLEWAETTEQLRIEAEREPQTLQLVNGMHRFLMEDRVTREPGISRSQARKRTREPAWEMVRRSRAWGRVVGACFPQAVRLSIHPQHDVSPKIGVHLLPVDDVWLTPWHGVAVVEEDRIRLMKRAAAEALGARLQTRDGGPSHYVLD